MRIDQAKLYIASAFFNEYELSVVERIENLFDEYGLSYFSPRKVGVVYNLSELKKSNPEEFNKACQDIYVSNIVNMRSCTGMISVLDWRPVKGGIDEGVLVEFGYAAAIRHYNKLGESTWKSGHNPFKSDKPNGFALIGFLSDDTTRMNIMLRQEVDSIIRGFTELEKFLRTWKEFSSISDDNALLDTMSIMGRNLTTDAI